MAANYANLGRSYRDLSIDEFTARWITSFREIAADLRNYKARAVTADLKSEFDLRTIAPPYDLAKGELNKLASALASTMEEIRGGRPWQVRGNRKRHPLNLGRLTRVLPSPFAASISISREHAARNSIEVLVTFARTSAVICCLLSAFVFGAKIQVFGAPSQDLLASVA